MNKQIIASLLAGTTAICCSLAQETPPPPRGAHLMHQNQDTPPGMESRGRQRPTPPQAGCNPEGCPMMRGPGEGGMGQIPQMRGMMGKEERPPAGEPGNRRLLANPEVLKAAGVTDEKIQALQTAMQESRMKEIDLRAAVEKAELGLQILEGNSKSSEEELLKATENLSKARAEQLKHETLTKIQVKKILGEEALKKIHAGAQRRQGQPPPSADNPQRKQRPGPQPQEPAQ